MRLALDDGQFTPLFSSMNHHPFHVSFRNEMGRCEFSRFASLKPISYAFPPRHQYIRPKCIADDALTMTFWLQLSHSAKHGRMRDSLPLELLWFHWIQKILYRGRQNCGPQVARMLQASWGRRDKQQQKQNSPNLGTTILPAPVIPRLMTFITWRSHMCARSAHCDDRHDANVTRQKILGYQLTTFCSQ